MIFTIFCHKEELFHCLDCVCSTQVSGVNMFTIKLELIHYQYHISRKQ